MKTATKLLALLLALLLLAGCGAKPASSAAPAASAPASSEEAPAESEPAESSEEDEAPFAVVVTDDLGRTVAFDTPPQNVAVLIGSFAETWQLAGGTIGSAVRDAWDDFDLNLGDNVKNLGKYNEISMELLFEAEPDLVILSGNTKNHLELQETLEAAGIPALYFVVNGFEDYLNMLKICTEITARPDLYEQNGLAVAEQVEKAKADAAAAAAEQGQPRVLLLRIAASGVHAKGSEGTVTGLILHDLSCINIADGSDLLEDLSLEKIIEEDPDHIFIVQQGNDTEGAQKTLEETLTGNPAWAGLTAVKEGRVHVLDRYLYHFKPNNRWGTSYENLETILYGEK